MSEIEPPIGVVDVVGWAIKCEQIRSDILDGASRRVVHQKVDDLVESLMSVLPPAFRTVS